MYANSMALMIVITYDFITKIDAMIIAKKQAIKKYLDCFFKAPSSILTIYRLFLYKPFCENSWKDLKEVCGLLWVMSMDVSKGEKLPKTVIGAVEKISINGCTILARVDTGAATSSIDLGLAGKLRLGPLVGKKTVVSAHGSGVRPVVKLSVKLGGREIRASFTLISRDHMKYPVLIGRNILKENFIIDPDLPKPSVDEK